MRNRCLLLFLFAGFALGLAPPSFGQASSNGTITGTGCVSIGVTGQSTVAMTLAYTASGSHWSGTIQPQVAMQGQAAANVQVTPSTSSTAQSTITANGVYVANVAGYDLFLLCGGSVTNTAAVFLNSTKQISSLAGGGGGGGSGTVTGVLGTTNQIASDGSATTPTLSIPSTFIAPGTLSAVTSIDATKLLGNLPALSAASLTGLPLTTGVTGVLPAANGGVGKCTTAAQCYVLLPYGTAGLGVGSPTSTVAAGALRCGMFSPDKSITFTKAGVDVIATSSTNHELIALYTADRSTVVTQITFTLGAGTGALAASAITNSPVTLLQGTEYWECFSADNATSTVEGATSSAAVTALNANTVFWGLGANTLSGTTMPASIGVVSTNNAVLPQVELEP